MAMSGVCETLRDTGFRFGGWLKLAADYASRYPLVTLGAIVTTSGTWLVTWSLSERRHNLPPGPLNLPIIGTPTLLHGNMLQNLLNLGDTYGDVIYVKIFGRELVVLNSERVIREAFLGKAQEFSHRQKSYFLDSVGTKGDEIFTAVCDEKWKSNKKFATRALKSCSFETEKSHTKVMKELRKLEGVILEHGGQAFTPVAMFGSFAASMLLSIYLSEDRALDDPILTAMTTQAQEYNEAFEEGFFWCDEVLPDWPLLKEYVCKVSLTKGRRAEHGLMTSLEAMLEEHRSTHDAGEETRDIMDYYRAYRPEVPERVLAANMLIVIPDACATVGHLLSWTLFYVTQNQQVQEKLRCDIDRSVGRSRDPTTADREHVPYAAAIILETLRCVDLFPMMLPRVLQRDVEVGGFTVPRTAVVVGLLHAVHYDPGIFPDPAEFDPSRFIDHRGQLDPAMAGRVLSFGIGTRKSPGEQYVKSLCFLSLIFLAQRFTLTSDPSQPLPPSGTGSGLRPPPPHKLQFIPR